MLVALVCTSLNSHASDAFISSADFKTSGSSPEYVSTNLCPALVAAMYSLRVLYRISPSRSSSDSCKDCSSSKRNRSLTRKTIGLSNPAQALSDFDRRYEATYWFCFQKVLHLCNLASWTCCPIWTSGCANAVERCRFCRVQEMDIHFLSIGFVRTKKPGA